MRKTKFYSVFVAFVIAMFAAIAAAVAFAVPSKSIAKADEGEKVYKFAGLTGPTDGNRNSDQYYFGVSMPNSIKPGDTFEISVGFLNSAAGVTSFDFGIYFSNGFTIIEEKDDKKVSDISDEAKALFEERSFDESSYDQGHWTLMMMRDSSKHKNPDEMLIYNSFIELFTVTVKVDDIAPTDEDLDVHYYMYFEGIGSNEDDYGGVGINTVDDGGDWELVDVGIDLVHYPTISEEVYGSELIVKGLASEDVTMATGYPVVSANGVTLNGELGIASEEYREDNVTLSQGAPGIGGLRHTTYQSYDLTSKLSYSTESLTVKANANDSDAVVKMLTNPTGDDSEGNEKYTIVDNNTKTFDISALTPNVTNAEAVAGGAEPVYETDVSEKYYKYTLPYIYEVFAPASGYVRVYSITFYKEIEAPEELPLTLNSVKLVSKDNVITYNSSYDEATRTYTILDADGTNPLTISYADAKQDEWRYWSIVAERTYTGSEVTTTGDGIVTLTAGSNKFQLVISDGEDSETYFVEVNVAEANTDKSLSSVIIKNKTKPSENFDIIGKANAGGNVFTADEFEATKIGETWMVEATATKDGLVDVTYTIQEKVLTVGENVFYVKVTDQLGDFVEYTVIIPITANYDTSLSVLKADDTDLTKGSDGNYFYKIADTVNHFYLTAEATESTSNVAVFNAGSAIGCIEGNYLININLSDTVKKQEITVMVTSEANTVANYTIIVTRLSSDATLKSVYIKNSENKTYAAVIDDEEHTCTISGLTYADSLNVEDWTMYVEANSEGAEYTKSQVLTSFEDITITVIPETGEDDALTYTVTISVVLSSDATLKSVYIKNAANDTYQAIIDNEKHTCTISGLTYKESLNPALWTLYVFANSESAEYTSSKVLTRLDNNTIKVTPETGEDDAVTYTLIINCAAGDENANLKVVYISNGTDSLIAVIDNDEKTCVINNMTYAQSLETWTMHVEAESPLAVYAATVELTSLDGNTIIVTPEKGDAVEYTVTINRLPANTDSNVTISAKAGNQDVELSLSGNTYYAIVDFDDIQSVTVTVATSDLATVKIDGVEARSKNVTLAVGDTVTEIEVTAEDGSVSTYSVIISAYTEVAGDDTETFIEITGGVKVTLTQSDILSNSYIVKEAKVSYKVSGFTLKISVPEYVKVTIAYGSNATVITSDAQTAIAASAAPDAAANDSTVTYTVKLKSLNEGNNAISLQFTDTRTGVVTTYVQNVFRAYKSNGALIAFLVIFLILFVAVTVLFVLTVLGILDIKKLFSKIFKKKSAKSE